MKRFFILASAAIVALASCAKTEVVYKDGPQEIAFKQITGVMTKADLSSDYALGVMANQNSNIYFTNTSFGHNGTNWTNTDVYWPYEGTLDFTVYAPYVDGANYADNVLTIPSVTPGENVYYGVQRYVDTAKQDAVAVVLQHVSAKILVNLNLTAGSLYTVNWLKLVGVNTQGTVNVQYGSPVTVTTTPGTVGDSSFIINDTDANTSGINLAPVYVLPGDQTKFTINFTQENGDHDVTFTKDITLAAADVVWAANTAYTYNISIANPDNISFTATVNNWTTTSAVDKSVQ